MNSRSNSLIFFLLLSATLALLPACRKNSPVQQAPPDSRDGYTGEYQGILTISCYGPGYTCYSVHDTLIPVGYGSTDTTLLVMGREVYLDSASRFYAYHYGLAFRNDSLFSTFMNGGLGMGRMEVFRGRRIRP